MKLDLYHTVRALFIGLLALGLAPHALGQKWARKAQDTNTVPGVVYVRFIDGRAPFGGVQSGFSSFDQLTTDLQVRSLTRAFPMADAIAAKQPASESTRWLQGVNRLEYDAPIAPSSVARWLSNSPEVDMVEPQYIYKTVGEVAPLADPNDPDYSTHQGYLARLELDDAWDTVKGDSGDVVIAIVDDGFELTHQDLSGNLWVNSGEIAGNNIDDDNNGLIDDIHGWNYESGRPNTASVDGDTHGMRVGGVANAETDNSLGIAGAAWNAQTMALNAGCVGDLGMMCHTNKAILYAINNGADIINCSWATQENSSVLHRTILSALDNGILVVAAAGNENQNLDHKFLYPASHPEVLSVGGTKNASNKKSAISNFGRSVNVFAASENVRVTGTNNGYRHSGGTSFAAPQVAGIAALVMTERPDLDPEQVRELIRLTSRSIDSDNDANLAGLLGSGLPDADEALTATIPPALRLTSYKITDAGGDDNGQPGEEITIKATFKNYGGNASNVSVGFSTAEPYMDWNTSSATVATLNYGESYTGTYSFDVARNVPDDYQTPIFTRITQGTFTDSPDVISHTLNLQLPWITHANSTTKFSVGGLGNLGHQTTRSGKLGSKGFQRNTSGGWVDFMYEGGLMLGTSRSNFADCVTGSGFFSGSERDFAVKSGTTQSMTKPGSVGSQDGLLTLVESSTSGSSLKVEVAVNSYTFDASVDDDYVILHYEITNTGSNTLSGLYAGIYADLDAKRGRYGDKVTFDTARRTGYQEAASGSSEVVGVRLLSSTGALNYDAIKYYDTVDGGFSNFEKFASLSGGVGTTSISGADISQVIGAGPISISAGGTVDVAVALIHGGSASEFLTNADAAQRKWHSIAGDGIELSADVTTVSESDGATTVTVTAETANSSNLASAESYTITATGSGTASAVDFGAISPFSIAVASGSSSGTGTFTLTPTNDSVDETNETITLGSSSLRVVEGATITLTDDDATPSGIALTASADTVDEGDGATTVTVTGTVSGSTTFGASQDLPIRVTGSGTDGAVDFASVADFDLSVAAEGSSGSATFTLTPTDDQNSETDETITISSTSSLVSNSPTIVITDNDGGGTIDIELSADVTSLSESASATTVTVTAATKNSNNVASDQALTISVAGSGTASAVDFAAVSDFTITISSGSSSGTGTFSLTPTNDSVDETDETITISSTSSLVSQNATITLTDDDATPAGITLVVSEDTVDEGEGSTTITLTGTVSGSTTYGTAQTLPMSAAGAGTASAVDFAAISDFNLEIAAEGTKGTATFTVTPTDDNVDEADETITLSSSSNAVSNSPTVVITDDDAAPTGITLVVSEDTVDEGDGATTITLTGTVGGTTTYGAAQTLPISAAGSGTASAVDFSAISDFDLAIAAEGAKGTATFTVTPTDDQTSETDETITLSSTSSLVSNSPTVVITDNDGGGAIDIKLTSSVSTLSESASATTVTVTAATKSGSNVASDQALTISVAGSGTASAVDFAAVSDFTITISSGSSSGTGTFTLTPTNDAVDETDETITISSSSALVSTNATITLTDDDATPAGINLVVSEDTVDEGDGSTTVTLTGTVSGSTTYGTAQTLSMVAAGSGTASAVDFAAISDFSLEIAAEATKGTATFTVTPTTDQVDETDETITLSSSSKAALTSPTVTITDDDATPSGVTLTLSSTSIAEGAGATTVTVTGTVGGTTTYGSEADAFHQCGRLGDGRGRGLCRGLGL